MPVDMFTIIRRGTSPEGLDADAARSIKPRDFRENEARILADIYRGDLTLKEGINLIKRLETSSARVFDFQVPGKDQLLSSSFADLNDLRDNNRSYFKSQSKELQHAYMELKFCGKGEMELEGIIKSKSGEVNVHGVEGASSIDEHSIELLEEAAYKACKACTLGRREGLKVDSLPGGIIALRGVSGNNAEITPQNFGRILVGIVGYERIKDIFVALQSIYSGMENPTVGRDEAGLINDLQLRENLTKQFMAHTILNDLLKCI